MRVLGNRGAVAHALAVVICGVRWAAQSHMALDERKGVVIESRAARANSSAQILPCLLDLMTSDDVTRLFLTLCTQILLYQI